MRVRYSLLAEGTSDRLLMCVISWTLQRLGVAVEQALWADLSVLPKQACTLINRVDSALRLYPCDILFVHRDADGKLEDRREEVRRALASVPNHHPHVPVVPVRMTEAWLLHDEPAIRRASGNPSGKVALNLPRPASVESLPDPKRTLFDALLTATELGGRKRDRRKKDLPRMRARVADLIDDFSPLDRVPAFRQFLDDLKGALQTLKNTDTEAPH